jgi:hypothetical protein
MGISGRVHRFLNLLSEIYKKEWFFGSYATIARRRVRKDF